MDKIKAFFQNTIVQIIAWLVLVVDVVALILGGASVAEISNGAELTFGIISAIALLIAFIADKINKKK